MLDFVLKSLTLNRMPCFFFDVDVSKELLYIFFFFFNDIDERRRYTKKVHPLKAWVGPLHREKKNKRGFMDWVGVEGVCGRGS